MNDLRLAFRHAANHPAFTVTIVLILAIGIGATTAMFSLFDTVLLRPLPVPEPQRLVNLTSPGPRIGGWSTGIAGGADSVFSYPMFRDLEDGQDVLTGLAAHRTFDANISKGVQPESSQGLLVSGQYFDVLGIRPALGRFIGPQDEPQVGESTVVVLSHAFWRSRLGGDPGVLGKMLVVNGQSLTVIGVAPDGFSGTTIGVEPSVYVPLTLAWLMQPGMANDASERGWHWLHVFGRLRDGVTIEQAAESLNALHAGILSDVEAPMFGLDGDLLDRFTNRPLLLEAGARGQSSRRENMRRPLRLLLGLTGLVLLIACVNVASLLLVRGASREGEIAVRISVGATRWHLIRQLLSEIGVIVVIGGLASLAVAALILDRITTILPPERSGITATGLDASAALFAAAASVTSMLVFGIVPLLRTSSRDSRLAQPSVVGGSHRTGRGSFWISSGASQIALALVTLVLAGLFAKSLFKISHIDLGMDIDHVSSVTVSPSLNGYDSERIGDVYRRLSEALSSEPGVLAMSSALVPILSFSNFNRPVAVAGFESAPGVASNASFNIISPGFFRTFSIPMLAGRDFTPAEERDSARVAIVNESFMRKFDLGEALGKYFSFPNAPDTRYEIVGIVADAKYNQVKGETPAQYYLPGGGFGSMTFYVRSSLSSDATLRAIRGTVARVDPDLPLDALQSVTVTAHKNVFLDRAIAIFSTVFAGLATLLAAIGLYGVLAYNMSRRTRELGLRLALGSTRQRLGRLVMVQAGKMALIGSVLGLAAAVILGRLVESMLFGLPGFEPSVTFGALAVLGIVASMASYLPARRAMRVDPMAALRED